jgi:hypothetical protein
MTEKELFLFDLRGYLVIDQVLTAAEVAAGNTAVDHHLELIQKREPGLAQGGEHLVASTGRGEFRQNPLTFARPWCEPFRRMLTHPQIVDLFNEVLGPGFRLDHGTLPWRPEDRMRRSILFKYSPGFMSWGRPHGRCPIADPTSEEGALYEPPFRTGRTTLGES